MSLQDTDDGDELHLLEDIRRQALAAVWKPDRESFLRRVFRSYSEKFHTPLHQVQDLPLVEVLTHYYEALYDDMSDAEQYVAAKELSRTEEEKQATAEADEKWMMEILQKEQEKERKPAPPAPLTLGLKPRRPRQPAQPPAASLEKFEEIVMNFVEQLDPSIVDGPSVGPKDEDGK